MFLLQDSWNPCPLGGSSIVMKVRSIGRFLWRRRKIGIQLTAHLTTEHRPDEAVLRGLGLLSASPCHMAGPRTKRAMSPLGGGG